MAPGCRWWRPLAALFLIALTFFGVLNAASITSSYTRGASAVGSDTPTDQEREAFLSGFLGERVNYGASGGNQDASSKSASDHDSEESTVEDAEDSSPAYETASSDESVKSRWSSPKRNRYYGHGHDHDSHGHYDNRHDRYDDRHDSHDRYDDSYDFMTSDFSDDREIKTAHFSGDRHDRYSDRYDRYDDFSDYRHDFSDERDEFPDDLPDDFDDHHDFSDMHDRHDRYDDHYEEDEEDSFYKASMDCRFEVNTYAKDPEECSKIEEKDYQADPLFDNPHKTSSRGACFWDFELAKLEGGGNACLCPRKEKGCKTAKQCYWFKYKTPDHSKKSDKRDGKDKYYGRGKKDRHEDKDVEAGVCMHNSERFYNLMAQLLAKRGKKQFALNIKYNSAPARGKLPYGPHGPAVVGFGEELGKYLDARYPDHVENYQFDSKFDPYLWLGYKHPKGDHGKKGHGYGPDGPHRSGIFYGHFGAHDYGYGKHHGGKHGKDHHGHMSDYMDDHMYGDDDHGHEDDDDYYGYEDPYGRYGHYGGFGSRYGRGRGYGRRRHSFGGYGRTKHSFGGYGGYGGYGLGYGGSGAYGLGYGGYGGYSGLLGLNQYPNLVHHNPLPYQAPTTVNLVNNGDGSVNYQVPLTNTKPAPVQLPPSVNYQVPLTNTHQSPVQLPTQGNLQVPETNSHQTPVQLPQSVYMTPWGQTWVQTRQLPTWLPGSVNYQVPATNVYLNPAQSATPQPAPVAEAPLPEPTPEGQYPVIEGAGDVPAGPIEVLEGEEPYPDLIEAEDTAREEQSFYPPYAPPSAHLYGGNPAYQNLPQQYGLNPQGGQTPYPITAGYPGSHPNLYGTPPAQGVVEPYSELNF